MKLSLALLAAVASAEDKKVPPRHPLQRLGRLTEFSAEILDDWFKFVPSVENWKKKFKTNAKRMERNFNRGNQRCGFYDAEQVPRGGPSESRERRSDDDFERYDREDPSKGMEQITTGYRKWAERYLSQCSGQRLYQHQVNRMNLWNGKLQTKLAKNSPLEISSMIEPLVELTTAAPTPAAFEATQPMWMVAERKRLIVCDLVRPWRELSCPDGKFIWIWTALYGR